MIGRRMYTDFTLDLISPSTCSSTLGDTASSHWPMNCSSCCSSSQYCVSSLPVCYSFQDILRLLGFLCKFVEVVSLLVMVFCCCPSCEHVPSTVSFPFLPSLLPVVPFPAISSMFLYSFPAFLLSQPLYFCLNVFFKLAVYVLWQCDQSLE